MYISLAHTKTKPTTNMGKDIDKGLMLNEFSLLRNEECEKQ